jgi:hypothetical protein
MKKQWILGSAVAVMLSLAAAPAVLAQHKAPNQQPGVAASPAAPQGEILLGTARIPRGVMADGKPLPAGSYQVKVTAQEAKPEAVGTTEPLERWAEFLQRGAAKGREVVIIVPQSEIKMVVKDAPPRPGAPRIQLLRGNEYLRVWFNKDGNHYLIYFPAGGAAAQP